MKYRYHMTFLMTMVFVLIGLREIITPLCIIFFLAYLFNKPVTYLEQIRISRRVSTLLLIVCMMILLVGLVIFVLPLLTHKIVTVIQKGPDILDAFLDELEPWLCKLLGANNNEYAVKIKLTLRDHVLNNTRHSLYCLLNVSSGIANMKNLVYYFGAMPFLSYYLTVDWPYLSDYMVSILPKNIREQTHDILECGAKMFSNYIHGQTVVCLLLSFMYSVGLYLVGFKNPMVVGCLMGILTFIPYLGAMLGFMLIVLFMLADFYSIKMFLQVCMVVLSLNLLEGQILAPYIIGKKLGISPMVLILALIVGNYYFGLVGMVLAYPLTATVFQTWNITREKYKL